MKNKSFFPFKINKTGNIYEQEKKACDISKNEEVP